MEKINVFELLIKNTKNEEINENNEDIIKLLNELAEINPKCLCEDDYGKLINCLPLTLNTSNNLVLAAGCNVIASLCSDEIARHYFGEKITVFTVNILKSCINNYEIKNIHSKECLLQVCRAIGNLCYYHEQNTKIALKEGCLLITMKILKTNTEENIHPVLIGLLLNLTHLDDFNYNFPEEMIEELNLIGLQYMEYNNKDYKTFINLISVMINIVRKTPYNSKIKYEECFFIDCLLEKYNMHLDIAIIYVKFIKQVSKICNVYNWILERKYKILVQIVNKYEESQEEEAKLIVKKICDIITLLSNDDGSIDNNKQLDVLYLVEWLLLKINSHNLYIKLSSVRSLGNFSRFKYESNNTSTPAKIIIRHIVWFINTLEKAIKDNNSLMEVSILCLFKNLLYVTNFETIDENNKIKLIELTIKVLDHTTYNPIIMKSLDIINCIIKKGEIGQKHLILYKSSNFIKLVTTYCNSVDEDITKQAKQLLYSINEDINIPEIDILNLEEENK